ncbi:hypothetical protein [Natronococcus sp. A-GB7]|uniref:hypothetical protein n=1 Tax=Natronococcus sp. A-GB7 TaxID=3037649 RepID=UPI00241C8169|nr:hypothetical protein [Natronococcus sp. A-GB7]MDG5820779.1 hypothetical protein [Natronococcus sp. A-GB7]
MARIRPTFGTELSETSSSNGLVATAVGAGGVAGVSMWIVLIFIILAVIALLL